MPDSGTSFTWATRAFGPWVGWMAGWGLIAATILVLSNLAGIAVEFLFLLIAQIAGQPRRSPSSPSTRSSTSRCACCSCSARRWISYRDMQTTQKLQYCAGRLPGARARDLLGRRVRAGRARATRSTPAPIELSWFNPFAVGVVRGVVGGPLALDLHLLGVGRHPHDERGDEGPREDARPRGDAHGRHDRRAVPAHLGLAARVRGRRHRRSSDSGNEDIQANVFFYLSGPILGPLAVPRVARGAHELGVDRCSRRSSRPRARCSRWATTARCRRSSRRSARGSSRPGYATIVSAIVASVFYAVMRFLSEDVLWDTITDARHDDLLLLRHHGVRVRVVLPQAVVRLGAQRLLHPAVPARRRRDPRACCSSRRSSTAWTPTTAAARTSSASASCSCSAWSCCLGCGHHDLAGDQAAGVLPRRDALAGRRRGVAREVQKRAGRSTPEEEIARCGGKKPQ